MEPQMKYPNSRYKRCLLKETQQYTNTYLIKIKIVHFQCSNIAAVANQH